MSFKKKKNKRFDKPKQKAHKDKLMNHLEGIEESLKDAVKCVSEAKYEDYSMAEIDRLFKKAFLIEDLVLELQSDMRGNLD